MPSGCILGETTMANDINRKIAELEKEIVELEGRIDKGLSRLTYMSGLMDRNTPQYYELLKAGAMLRGEKLVVSPDGRITYEKGIEEG